MLYDGGGGGCCFVVLCLFSVFFSSQVKIISFGFYCVTVPKHNTYRRDLGRSRHGKETWQSRETAFVAPAQPLWAKRECHSAVIWESRLLGDHHPVHVLPPKRTGCQELQDGLPRKGIGPHLHAQRVMCLGPRKTGAPEL